MVAADEDADVLGDRAEAADLQLAGAVAEIADPRRAIGELADVIAV